MGFQKRDPVVRRRLSSSFIEAIKETRQPIYELAQLSGFAPGSGSGQLSTFLHTGEIPDTPKQIRRFTTLGQVLGVEQVFEPAEAK